MRVTALFLMSSFSLFITAEGYNCGPLKDVPYGIVDYPQGIETGSKAVITCNPGYVLVGKKEITCGNQGWLDREPVCEVVSCPPPPEVVNGYFPDPQDAYKFPEVVSYSCKDGFTLSGSKQLSCSENGKFSPAPPTCVWVECKDPVIANAKYVEGSRPPHKFSATVMYRCNPGYTMNGKSSITCDIKSQWSPGVPNCTPTDSSKPRDSGNAVGGGFVGGFVSMAVMLVQHYWM